MSSTSNTNNQKPLSVKDALDRLFIQFQILRAKDIRLSNSELFASPCLKNSQMCAI